MWCHFDPGWSGEKSVQLPVVSYVISVVGFVLYVEMLKRVQHDGIVVGIKRHPAPKYQDYFRVSMFKFRFCHFDRREKSLSLIGPCNRIEILITIDFSVALLLRNDIIAYEKQQTTNNKPQTTNNKQQTTLNRQPTTHNPNPKHNFTLKF